MRATYLIEKRGNRSYNLSRIGSSYKPNRNIWIGTYATEDKAREAVDRLAALELPDTEVNVVVK